MAADRSALTSPERGRILLVDDDAAVLRVLTAQLESRRYQVLACADASVAIAALADFSPDAAVVDYALVDTDGITLMGELRRRDVTLSVLLLSGEIDVPLTVQALRAGAEDVLIKPPNIEHLTAAIDRGVARTRLARAHRLATTRVDDPYGLLDESPAMKRVIRQIEHMSASTAPVLITGEAGTGKSAVAELLHRLSPLASRPYVVVSCVDLPARELDSALVGDHGAGLVARAAGGTLHLAGVTTLAPSTQGVLLALLGGQSDPPPGLTPGSVRLVTSTARDLAEDVRRGTLRADLYQRMAMVPIAVPPLRARGEDAIRALAARFVDIHRANLGEGPLGITEDAGHVLSEAEWPGNVRQLRAVLEDAFAAGIAEFAIDASHVRGALDRRGIRMAERGDSPDGMSLRDVERRHIARVLAMTGGQRSEAARILGITRTTLYKKIADYALDQVGRP